MSRADFNRAKRRLERMKQEMLWALAVLEDPVANLEEYKLTQDEMDELFQECHMELAEILTPLAQVLSKKVRLKVENKIIKVSGPVPPGLSRMGESVEVEVRYEPEGKSKSEAQVERNKRVEFVGPGGPTPKLKPKYYKKSEAEQAHEYETEFVGPDGPSPERSSDRGLQFGGESHLSDE